MSVPRSIGLVPRQPRVTTRTGDDGSTSLYGRARVPKHDPRIGLVGDLDEAQSAMGLGRALARAPVATQLLELQRQLYVLMAQVATSPERAPAARITTSDIADLERRVEELRAKTALSAQFVVPGGDPASAAIDIARTVVRRAERAAAQLLTDGALADRDVLRYLNRLSDVLFMLARAQEGNRRTVAKRRRGGGP